jgi:phosphatidylglycerophosphatase A
MKKFTDADGLSKLIATFFGLGYFPVIAGTLGAAAGAVIYYFLRDRQTVFCGVLSLVLIAGFATTGRAAKAIGKKDPRSIVIDEVSGMLVALAFMPFSVLNLAIIFVLFRVFDVLKPYPIRKLESLPGSAGIMLDDIAAGVYANLIFQLLLRFALCRAV